MSLLFTKIDQKTRKIGQICIWNPLTWIYYVNIGLCHQYGISAVESQTFLRAKRSRQRRARRNGCFRRLLLNQPIIIDRAYRWEVEQDFHWNFLVKFNRFLGFLSGQFVCRNWSNIQTWCERPFSTAQVTCRCQNCQITKDDD